ncbi:MAG: methyltransferase domain-containing protein, partial [Candidatus Omnitrophica bacterium]|nr:methyltransferase domain-containing protein [Candidatus Omnitrophota bacterium]
YNIYDKPLPELNLPNNSFDVITIFDVLAHLKDPVSYINTCTKLLKPGGYLVIKTPYHSPLLFFIAGILSFTGKSRSLLHIPAQIFHFNPRSLSVLLSSKNFKPLSTTTINDFSPILHNSRIFDKTLYIRYKCLLIIYKYKINETSCNNSGL